MEKEIEAIRNDRDSIEDDLDTTKTSLSDIQDLASDALESNDIDKKNDTLEQIVDAAEFY